MKGKKKAKNNDISGAIEQNEQLSEAAATEATAAHAKKKKAEKVVHTTPDGKEGVLVEGKVISKKERNLRVAKRWTLMTLGVVIMAASIYFFQNPNHFTLGGMAGLSIVLSELIGVEFLTYDIINIIINAILLVVGLIVLGKQCTYRTIYCTLLYTGLIILFEHLHLIDHINNAVGRTEIVEVVNIVDGVETVEKVTKALTTLTDEPFLELCYAILAFGVGGALIFNCGSSTGGTDIIALILKKYTRLNVGVALMIIDLIVVCISFYTIIDYGVSVGLYSLLGLFTKSFLLDGVIENMGKTKYITVVTTKPEEIGEYILKSVQHSYTMYDAEGGYSHEKKKVLVTVCKRSEALKIKVKVKNVDPQAFVIITDANEIIGKGFGGTI